MPTQHIEVLIVCMCICRNVRIDRLGRIVALEEVLKSLPIPPRNDLQSQPYVSNIAVTSVPL